MVTIKRIAHALMVVGSLAATAQLALPSESLAVATLRLTQNGNTITIADDLLGDALSGQQGAISFVGSIGVFTSAIPTGVTKPIEGSATVPKMHLV
jgi:hypothetical protein